MNFNSISESTKLASNYFTRSNSAQLALGATGMSLAVGSVFGAMYYNNLRIEGESKKDSSNQISKNWVWTLATGAAVVGLTAVATSIWLHAHAKNLSLPASKSALTFGEVSPSFVSGNQCVSEKNYEAILASLLDKYKKAANRFMKLHSRVTTNYEELKEKVLDIADQAEVLRGIEDKMLGVLRKVSPSTSITDWIDEFTRIRDKAVSILARRDELMLEACDSTSDAARIQLINRANKVLEEGRSTIKKMNEHILQLVEHMMDLM